MEEIKLWFGNELTKSQEVICTWTINVLFYFISWVYLVFEIEFQILKARDWVVMCTNINPDFFHFGLELYDHILRIN